MRIAIYPGSFDPLTNGHLDIVERSSHIFDKVILGIAINNNKQSLFSPKERLEMIRLEMAAYPQIEVEIFEGLLMHYAREKGAVAVIRGLRAVSDFEYEFQMSLMNKKLVPEIETVFLMTSAKNTFVSSSLIKQVMGLGGDIHGLVPDVIEKELLKKIKKGQYDG